MSSMRNAAPRRPHRERSQPQARAKWGLLEKHKDYSLRAADYNLKKKKLKVLSQKSRERNPDEFAFGMLSADKAKAGKHGRGDGEKNKLDHRVVEGLKAQDAGYLRTAMSRNRRQMEVLKEQIGLGEVLKRAVNVVDDDKKTYFDADGQPLRKKRKTDDSEDGWSEDDLSPEEGDEDEDEDEHAEDLNSDMIFEMDPEVVHAPVPAQNGMSPSEFVEADEEDAVEPARPTPPSKKQIQKQADDLARRKLEKRRRQHARAARTAKLEILKKRQKSIMAAASELELQRARMAKTIGGTNKNGVKFKIRERKR